ncbi:MAG: hypothetical protein KatS3mg059_1189 [Thermomicrobiales bacterium]|nr:MAG: hypothetical protein KatS3mg059_1189 [Thermomicrobiales bacterium]
MLQRRQRGSTASRSAPYLLDLPRRGLMRLRGLMFDASGAGTPHARLKALPWARPDAARSEPPHGARVAAHVRCGKRRSGTPRTGSVARREGACRDDASSPSIPRHSECITVIPSTTPSFHSRQCVREARDGMRSAGISRVRVSMSSASYPHPALARRGSAWTAEIPRCARNDKERTSVRAPYACALAAGMTWRAPSGG